MTKPLRFHWRLLQGGDLEGAIAPERFNAATALPEIAAQIAFCREAEQNGIDSVLVDVSSRKPEPMVLAMALAASTERLKFMVAHRPGLMSPTLFAQQVNTFSTLAPGRITLNMVAGHSPAEQLTYGDNLAHDARYERMKEYLTICARFWSGDEAVNFLGRHYRIADGHLKTPFVATDRRAPEIYVGGGSASAREAACGFADCWLRFADTPENVAEDAAAVRQSGIEIGLRLSCIVRPTRQEALDAARSLVEGPAIERRRRSEAVFVKASDASSMRRTFDLGETEWLTPRLWAGAVRTLGATGIVMVGTPDEVADEIHDFKEAGISQFILHGWPKLEEMRIFCRDVIPLVRRREQATPMMDPARSELVPASSKMNKGNRVETA
ncbi:MAG TPA: LLM class flavin-dependent oxidoreductase [Chthoniobacterales bacterium]|nr:LLM class flavin-dependent oxidoreductase [Chthoniobacterales bacterium]